MAPSRKARVAPPGRKHPGVIGKRDKPSLARVCRKRFVNFAEVPGHNLTGPSTPSRNHCNQLTNPSSSTMTNWKRPNELLFLGSISLITARLGSYAETGSRTSAAVSLRISAGRNKQWKPSLTKMAKENAERVSRSFDAARASAKEKVKKARIMVSGMGTLDLSGDFNCQLFKASHALPSFPFISRRDVCTARIPCRANDILPPVWKTC